MKREIPNPYPDGNCFYCGRNNKNGLKLKFFLNEQNGEVSTEYVPSSQFSGQGDILHGGIMMGIIDEIMGWTTYIATGEKAVTSDIHVKFISPVYLNKSITVICRENSREGPKVHLEVKATNTDGRLCVKATGTYHILSNDRYEKLTSAY
jgi:acyl-coenzyme A thioesterase PaaI-like protein